MIPWRIFRAELIGTALLVLVGLSVVILMFGEGSSIPGVLEQALGAVDHRFLFGTTGEPIRLSPVGKQRAHPRSSRWRFRLMGKLDSVDVLGYVVAQLAERLLGSLPTPCLGRDGPERGFAPRTESTAGACL